MSVREKLREAVQGVPQGGAVTLPVEAVRQWLREDAETGSSEGLGQKVYSTAKAADIAGVEPATIAEWAKDERLPNAWKTGKNGGGEWRIPEADLLSLMMGEQLETERVSFD